MLVQTKQGTVPNEGIAVVFVCNVLLFEGRLGLVNALLEILQHTLEARIVLLVSVAADIVWRSMVRIAQTRR
jgi:hypothetical protein